MRAKDNTLFFLKPARLSCPPEVPPLEQVAILTDQRPELAVVDRGYRGQSVEETSRCGW